MLCIALNAGVFSMPSKPLNLRSASSARSMNLSASLPSNVGIALISIAIIFLSFLQNFCQQEQRKLAFKLPGAAKVYAKVTICLEMASIKDHFLDYGKRIRHKIIFKISLYEFFFLQNNVTIVTIQDSYQIIRCLRVTLGAFSIVT